MADHLHKQIRAAIKTATTGLATTGANVFANRVQALDDSNLPGLRIYDDSEDAEALTIHQPQVQKRTYDVLIECCTKETGDPDAVTDQASKEVEVVLAAGIAVQGKSLDVVYRGMGRDRDISNKPVAIKRLRFTVSFTAMSNAPDVLI